MVSGMRSGTFERARGGILSITLAVVAALMFVEPSAAQSRKGAKKTEPVPAMYPALPSEIPAKFEPVTTSFDYVRRVVMIPMRDGVKLHLSLIHI